MKEQSTTNHSLHQQNQSHSTFIQQQPTINNFANGSGINGHLFMKNQQNMNSNNLHSQSVLNQSTSQYNQTISQANSQLSTINIHNQPYQSQIKQHNYNSQQPISSQYQNKIGSGSLFNKQKMMNSSNQQINDSLIQNSNNSFVNNYQNNYATQNQNYNSSSNTTSMRDRQSQNDCQKQLQQLKLGIPSNQAHQQQLQQQQLNNSYAGLLKSSSNTNLSKNDSSKNLNSAKQQLQQHLQQQKTFHAQFENMNMNTNPISRQEKENQNHKSSTQILEAHLKQQQQLINMTSFQQPSISQQQKSKQSSGSNLNESKIHEQQNHIAGTTINNQNSTTNIQVNVNINNSSSGMDLNGTQGSSSQVTATNALYQFLKNKHLSKEIQKRMTQDSNQNQSMKSINKSSSKVFLDGSKGKDEDQLELYKQQLRQNSSNKKRLGSSQANKVHNFNNQISQKLYDTQSSLSKGSSANNTPQKLFNQNYQAHQLSNSLKKVKSFSQFHKTSNYKEYSSSKQKNQAQQNIRSSSQLSKSPTNLNKSLNFNAAQPGISHTSSNINLLLNDSMNINNLVLQTHASNINGSKQNPTANMSFTQHNKSQSKGQLNKSQTKNSVNNTSNTALTQNWMNSFLEHYDKNMSLTNGVNSKQNQASSVVRNSTANQQQTQSSYQKFLNNSQQTQGLQKQNSKSGINISINKSTQNINANQSGQVSNKHSHGKSISTINQRRGSGIGTNNSNQSSIAANGTANYSQSSLNKSYQNIQKQNNDNKNSSQNLNASKSLKKNMSFLASTNPQNQQSSTQIGQPVITSSTAHSSKLTSAHYSSSNHQSAHNKSGTVLINNPSQVIQQQPTSIHQNNNSQSRYSSQNYNKSSQQNTNSQTQFQANQNNHKKKSSGQSIPGHSTNLSLTNNNITLNKSVYNTAQTKSSQDKQAQRYQTNQSYSTNQNGNLQNQSMSRQHQNQPSNSQKLHNQSQVLHHANNNLKSLISNDNQLAFQFDELLKNIDRQVETQVNPLKKFQLEDDINIDIEVPNDLEIDNCSPSGSNNLKDTQHYRNSSNLTQIKLSDTISKNRLEALINLMQNQKLKEKQSFNQEQEALIIEIFGEIINSQQSSHDGKSLSLVRDYLLRELLKARQNLQLSDKYQKLKENFEQEKVKRVEAEKRMSQMFEEFKKQQTCMNNQEKLLSTIKLEFKKLQLSDLNNQNLIKQLCLQTDFKANLQNLNGQVSQTLINQNLQQQKENKALAQSQVQNQIKKNGQSSYQINGNQTVAFHSKNKSAAINIPKLDLSKIKRDIDQVQINQQPYKQSEVTEINLNSQQTNQSDHNNFLEEDEEEDGPDLQDIDELNHSNIEYNLNGGQDAANDSDSDFILNDLISLKKSTIEVRESKLSQNQGRTSSVMNVQSDDLSDSDDFDDIRFNCSNNKSVVLNKAPNILVPPLDFSKLKVNQSSSQQQKQAQQQYQQQVQQYQNAIQQVQKQQLLQSQAVLIPSKKTSLLNQSMTNIYSSAQNNNRKSSSSSQNLNNSMSLITSSLSQSMLVLPQNQQLPSNLKPQVPPLKLNNLVGGQLISGNSYPGTLQNNGQNQAHNNNNSHNMNGNMQFKINMEAVKKQQCFQDEFMGQIDDFSESWRQAALKEQRT